MSKESDVAPPPPPAGSSGEGLRRRRGRDFDEVDARIAIPVAPGRQLLQSGISKYRNLSGRTLVVPGAALNAPPPDEPPFPRASAAGASSHHHHHHHKPRKSPHVARDEPPEPSPLERAQRLVAQKQFAAAIPYFSEALSAGGGGSAALQHQSLLRVFFERGSCYLAAQRYRQAIEDFSRVIALTPKNPQLFAKRARAYAHLQQHAAALSDYNEAVALAAEPAPSANSAVLRALFLARARVFAASKDTRSALDDLARAEATGGHRDAELFYERAHVHLERGDERLALRDLDRFLELQDDELAHQDVVDMTGVSAADEALERAQDVRFDRAKLLQKLAADEDARHRTDAELLEIEQGVLRSAAAGVTDADAGSTRAEKARGGGTGYRSAEAVALVLRAIKDYTLLLDVEPATMNLTEILLRRGEAYGSIGRFDNALRDLGRAHELSPSDFEVSVARAKLYQQQRDPKRAIAEMTAVLQLNGFFLDALFFRAKLFVETGDLAKAQRDYTSIIEAHYDVRSESYSDAGAAANATEKTPLLSKANGATSSSSSSSSSTTNTTNTSTTTASNSNSSKTATSKSPSQAAAAATAAGASTAKPVRYLSQYSKKALLQRARLWVQMNKFEEAIADYEQLKLLSVNEIDAQMELQDVLEKQAAFIEKERLEAEESLLQGEEQERLEAEAKKAAGGGSGAAAKKKKKKKAKKKKRPMPSEAGYVLLPDDEDDQGLAAVPVPGVDTGDDEDSEAIEVVVMDSHPEPSADDKKIEEESETPAAVAQAAAEVDAAVHTPAILPARTAAGGAMTMTREEAFESLWEDDDQAGVEEAVRPDEPVAHASSAVRVGVARAEQTTVQSSAAVKSVRDDLEEDDEAGVASDDRVGESGDDEAPSSNGGANGSAALREVIVDEKYLRKRQRQLEKLRSDIRQAWESRDRAAIEEMLERAERKQMADSLGDEIERAKGVLERLSSGAAVDDSDAVGEQRAESASADSAAAEQEVEQTVVPATTVPQVSAEEAAAPTAPSIAEATSTRGDAADVPVAPASSPSSAVLVRKRSFRNTQAAASAAADPDPATAASASTSSTPTSKPPSLVIRPIAYGQALQLAEQSQHQFLQNQRLLQEKDAEIASLRQLLAQSKRQAAIERFDEVANPTELATRLAALRNQFPHKQLRELENRVETLVNWMGPSEEADHTRHKILAFVYRVLEAANIALGTPILVFPTGSFPMKTYLPTADLDVCLLLPKELEQSWHFPVMHALCLAGSANSVGQSQSDGAGGGASMNGSPSPKLGGVGGIGGAVAGVATGAAGMNGFPSNTVRNVNFINADVRVIKCTVDNVSVDFTANRVGALGALLLLDSMDARVGKNHLLKKSLILIKAWCIHESGAYTASVPGSAGQSHTAGASGSPPAGHSVMGSSYGAFSTYAVNTAVMGLFNQYGSKITHPLQALLLFLDRMAEFPWHEAAMTLHGPVALSALASSMSLSSVLKKKRSGRNGGSSKADVSELHSAKITFEDVEHIRVRTQEQFGGFDASAPNGFKAGMFQIRVCNVVDPLDEKNNLARSVSVDWFPSMKRAFRLGRNRLAELLAALPEPGSKGGSGSSKRVDELDDFFVNSWKAYGRGDGWRPDLLVHPRQVWHGKQTAAAAVPSDPNEEELRWQSILPELVPMTAGPYQPQPQGAMYYPPQYVAHHHQPQHHHHSSHHHHHVHQVGGGSPHAVGGGTGLGLTEPMPYQQQQQPMYHRRSFDSNKSSPLKTMSSLRHQQQQQQQLSPGPASAAMSYAGGMPKSGRRHESPPATQSQIQNQGGSGR